MRPQEVTFRPRGCARGGLAVFLLAWLAGWAAGEWFAIRVLVWGVQSSGIERIISHPAGWLVGGFILVWVTFWTFGGIAAAIELARLAAGRDTLSVTSDGYAVRRAIGPFGFTRRFSARDVRDVFVSRRGGTLMLDTTRGDVVVTSYGTPDERRAIEREYSRRESALDALPAGWVAGRMPDGRVRIARAQLESPGCIVAVAIFGALCAAFALVFRGDLPQWGVASAAVLAALFVALFVWALLSRREWLVRRDEILLVTRFLNWSRERQVDNGSLHVEKSVDSDGDESFSLSGTSRGRNVLLLRQLHDDRTVLRLARVIEKTSGWSVRRDFHD